MLNQAAGGGIRLQNVNGDEIRRGTTYKVTVTNNFIVNNVAGLAGGGIAMADTLNSSLINNTIASNDSVGISDVETRNAGGCSDSRKYSPVLEHPATLC